MTVAKYFDEMSYGPAPESDIEARDWLARHASGFGHFINGAFVPSASGKTFDTFEPAIGKVLAKLANAGAADVDNAVAAARKAQASWARLPGHARARHLYALARMIQRHARLIAVVEAIDNGKPIRETRDLDVPLAAVISIITPDGRKSRTRNLPIMCRWASSARSSRGISRS